MKKTKYFFIINFHWHPTHSRLCTHMEIAQCQLHLENTSIIFATILVNNQIDAQFFMYVYFCSLHVSSSYVSIIRRIIVSMQHLVYVILCR